MEAVSKWTPQQVVEWWRGEGLSVPISICLSVCLYLYQSVYLSVYISIYMSVCLSISIYINLSSICFFSLTDTHTLYVHFHRWISSFLSFFFGRTGSTNHFLVLYCIKCFFYTLLWEICFTPLCVSKVPRCLKHWSSCWTGVESSVWIFPFIFQSETLQTTTVVVYVSVYLLFYYYWRWWEKVPCSCSWTEFPHTLPDSQVFILSNKRVGPGNRSAMKWQASRLVW